MACSACDLGEYKPANGSTPCFSCEPGTYLNATAGSSCLLCPSNSSSTPGSPAIEGCLCLIGYEPADRSQVAAGCSACAAGTAKGVDGSAACSPCEPGTFQGLEGSSVCLECSPSTYSELGAAECHEGDGVERVCVFRNLSLAGLSILDPSAPPLPVVLPLDMSCRCVPLCEPPASWLNEVGLCLAATCPNPTLEVVGCAASQVEFELDVLQVKSACLASDTLDSLVVAHGDGEC
eukprot:3345093-Rhodomonas_salina.1